jgi:lysine 2,3-aminomutase
MQFGQKHIDNHIVEVLDIQNESSGLEQSFNAFSDRWLPSAIFTKQTSDLLHDLREADQKIYDICLHSQSLQSAREQIIEYLNEKESEYFDLLSPMSTADVNITERSNAKECIRVFKNIVRTENERRAKFSALQALRNAIHQRQDSKGTFTHAFLCEIISLLHGMNGRGLSFLPSEDENIIENDCSHHEEMLNVYAQTMNQAFQRFAKGTSPSIVMRQKTMKKVILAYFNASESDWDDYHWHLKHILTHKDTIGNLVHLADDELAGLEMTEREKIPVQITPYYLSLFNPDGRDDSDRAIRAQVLPTAAYCNRVALNRVRGTDMDFMGEHYTSPIEGITRRYPSIVILKPFDSCPQICVYCQRNWEIRDLDHGAFEDSKMRRAINWIREHREISEVLVTGGDPLTLDNAKIGKILDQLADIDHVERIRIGTRTIVTMPSRIDEGFAALLRAYHKPGRRELVIMTHIEHATELTPEVIDAVSRIRQCGVSIYNQQVFTYYNSRKFETAFLRKNLKLCGIDPYYTFNTKGKEETADFRVPIARLLQERKEEARLLPGTARTDEPVFNVPRIGKSHLRSWQDHEPIMILADGRRVYRFLPWDSRLSHTKDYLYTDVAIYDYLKRLHLDGEDVDQYRSIWYYF